MNNNLDTMNSNEDWEATCLIYDATGELPIVTDWQRFSMENEVHRALLGNMENEPKPIAVTTNASVASIELPVLNMQTTIFGQPEHLAPDSYRFWMTLSSSQVDNNNSNLITGKQNGKNFEGKIDRSPIRLKLHFLYHIIGDATSDEFPVSVSVSLSSQYPETWPVEEKRPWLEWLNDKASSILSEQLTSYSVCDFVDHKALDYFPTMALDQHPNHDDFPMVLVFFPKPVSVHWQRLVPSLLYNAVTRDTVQHFSYRNSKQSSPDSVKPKRGSGHDNNDQEEALTDLWCQLYSCVKQDDKWLPRSCPICFDQFVSMNMVCLEQCQHYVCRECFTMYVSVQAGEIEKYRQQDLPFRCPITSCRQGIPVIGKVKDYLTASEMEHVRVWYKNLRNPVCRSMPRCLDCPKGVMRQIINNGQELFWVFCEKCSVKRCLYCMEKIRDEKMEHLSTTCKGAEILKFARRYLRASPEVKERCEAKYPWIRDYAETRVASQMAIREWLSKKEGQVCPNCSNGVVRIEGCFHIHCRCGTHFCYECGEELHPPYYGTHHCWENR